MKSLKYHPHLICFLGYVPDVISPLLLLEYCSNGDLLHFIREHKNQLVHVGRQTELKTTTDRFRETRARRT